jgi:AcrR family transcriptional regulator
MYQMVQQRLYSRQMSEPTAPPSETTASRSESASAQSEPATPLTGPTIPQPEPATARARLLAAVLGYVAANGVSDLRLRDIAAAIGTSHRMLIYHFGSREGLIVAVVKAVEEAQRHFLAELTVDPTRSPIETMRAMWQRLADPTLWPNERLFFEIYSLALQGRPGTAGLLDDIVDAWVEPAARLGERRGLTPQAARAEARLAVAVCRGLLLDLLASRDRPAVDAALERYLAQLEALDRLESGGPHPGLMSDQRHIPPCRGRFPTVDPGHTLP